MKLVNKQTGEVVEFVSIDSVEADEIEFTYVQASGHENSWGYRSLEKFNEEWRDYEPVEPLIKDEKIRKAVKVWAEANNVLEVFAGRVGDGTYMTLLELYDEDDERRRISVPSAFSPAGMKAGEAYTIAELCGEEEE